MSLIFKDPRLKKQMARLFVPFLLQELVVILTTLMSNLVLNIWGCGAAITTGIANAFQIFFLYNAIAGSICYVASLFMSQHYGRGAIDEVEKDYHTIIKAEIALGIIFFILVLAIPEQLFFFIDTSTAEGIEAKRCAVEYIRWFSPIFLLISPTMLNYTLMKNVRLEKFCTLSSIITFTLVLTFESASIFSLDPSHFGWALECAALSMVVARLGEFIFLFIVINKKGVVKFKFKELIKIDSQRFKAMARYGIPVVVSKISWGIGFIFVTIFSNNFNAIPSAVGLFEAHSIMFTYQNIISCLSNATAAVVAVTIGRELGANRLRKAKEHGDEIMRLLLVMGIIEMAFFMLFLPIAIVSTPGMTDQARGFLWKVFLIQCIAMIPRSYNAACSNGFFNVGGDTLYVMLIDGITAWVTIVPLGYIGLHLNWSPLLVYALIELEEVFKCPFNIWRHRTGKWVKNITNKKGIVFNE